MFYFFFRIGKLGFEKKQSLFLLTFFIDYFPTVCWLCFQLSVFQLSVGCGLIFTLFHNVFKFGVHVQLSHSLEVTNMPRTAKLLGSNLTKTFFFKLEILFQIKLSANYLSAYLLSA